MKINDFQGELTDVSAKKEALLLTLHDVERMRSGHAVSYIHAGEHCKHNESRVTQSLRKY